MLAGHRFISELRLWQFLFTYSNYGPSSKYKEEREKWRKPRNATYIYQNELGNACFQHDMAYGDFKHLPKRKALKKYLILLKIHNIIDIKITTFFKDAFQSYYDLFQVNWLVQTQ